MGLYKCMACLWVQVVSVRLPYLVTLYAYRAHSLSCVGAIVTARYASIVSEHLRMSSPSPRYNACVYMVVSEYLLAAYPQMGPG